MTPFDPAALLAILLTFYPSVSIATLQRARQERPEYFAAGTLGGTHGEKLALDDGRIFDLIFSVDGPDPARWQVIDVTHAGGEPIDPAFALAPGPLRPIDLAAWPRRVPVDTFQPLVGAALDALGGSDATLGRAVTELAGVADGADLQGAWDATLGGAPDVLVDLHRALDAAEPGELGDATTIQAAAIDGAESPFDVGDPGDLPDVGDPGDPPDEPAGGGVDTQNPGGVDTQGGSTGGSVDEPSGKIPEA